MDFQPVVTMDSNNNPTGIQQLCISKTISYGDDGTDNQANNDSDPVGIYPPENGNPFRFNPFQKENQFDFKGLSNKGKVTIKKNVKAKKYFIFKLKLKFSKTNNFESLRSKRSVIVNGVPRAISLFVEYLVVIDSTVYSDFAALYPGVTSSSLAQYISIYFCQLVNAVTKIKINFFVLAFALKSIYLR